MNRRYVRGRHRKTRSEKKRARNSLDEMTWLFFVNFTFMHSDPFAAYVCDCPRVQFSLFSMLRHFINTKNNSKFVRLLRNMIRATSWKKKTKQETRREKENFLSVGRGIYSRSTKSITIYKCILYSGWAVLFAFFTAYPIWAGFQCISIITFFTITFHFTKYSRCVCCFVCCGLSLGASNDIRHNFSHFETI